MSERSIIRPEIEASTYPYQGFINVRIDTLKLPQGTKTEYTVLETQHHASAIIAETKDEKIVIIKEYRHPTKKWIYSCPGGRIDKGETPLEAAEREFLEETGYTADSFQWMGQAFPFASFCDQNIHYIYAKGAYKIQTPKYDPFELIHTYELTIKEIYDMMKRADPFDGVLATGLFLKSFFNERS
jgi:ADP-ribose pyrophosphatase